MSAALQTVTSRAVVVGVRFIHRITGPPEIFVRVYFGPPALHTVTMIN